MNQVERVQAPNISSPPDEGNKSQAHYKSYSQNPERIAKIMGIPFLERCGLTRQRRGRHGRGAPGCRWLYGVRERLSVCLVMQRYLRFRSSPLAPFSRRSRSSRSPRSSFRSRSLSLRVVVSGRHEQALEMISYRSGLRERSRVSRRSRS